MVRKGISLSYVGMVIVWRAEQVEKAESDIATREVGRNTLTRSMLSIIRRIINPHSLHTTTITQSGQGTYNRTHKLRRR
jgi:hypothetical protein